MYIKIHTRREPSLAHGDLATHTIAHGSEVTLSEELALLRCFSLPYEAGGIARYLFLFHYSSLRNFEELKTNLWLAINEAATAKIETAVISTQASTN
jgi:hypothetical protein